MSGKKKNINSVRTALIVDNLSPFTPDITACLEKLGANYVRRSVSSLAEVTVDGNDNHDRSDYKVIDKNKKQNDFHKGGKNYDYHNHNHNHNNNNNNDVNTNGIGAFNNYDKVILSGRRLYSKDTNVVNSRIIKRCFEDNIPVLGICYGAEILALTLGGTLRRMDNPVHETIPVTVLKSSPLLSATNTATALSTMHVFESHRYCVAKLPQDFEVLASSDHCKYEIFSHKNKRLFGTQFHPEKSGTEGLNLLSNFLNL